jgi:hypothetical protein
MTGSIVAFCAYRRRLGGYGGGGDEEEDAKGEVDGAHFDNNVLNEIISIWIRLLQLNLAMMIVLMEEDRC